MLRRRDRVGPERRRACRSSITRTWKTATNSGAGRSSLIARRFSPTPKSTILGRFIPMTRQRRRRCSAAVASGGYTINLWFKLGHQLLNVETMGEVWALMGGIEWKLRFVRGVSPGMRLRFMRRVTGKRTSSKPGRGVLFLHSEIVDQDSGDPVMTIDEVALIARKASD